MKKAFEILLSDKGVTAIFLNIFGGIMRCDWIAEGVIKATKELQLRIPLVVRLKGNKEMEAKEYAFNFSVATTINAASRLIRESGLKIYAFDELDEAAEKAVQLGRTAPA